MKTCDRDEFMAWLAYRAGEGNNDCRVLRLNLFQVSEALSAGEKVGMTEDGKLVSYIDYDGEEFVETFLPAVD